MAFIAPDTSPRGCNIAGDKDSWDFGEGAGFYVDATAPLWANNYRMYSYVTQELLSLIGEHFPAIDLSRTGISGHSMVHCCLFVYYMSQLVMISNALCIRVLYREDTALSLLH